MPKSQWSQLSPPAQLSFSVPGWQRRARWLWRHAVGHSQHAPAGRCWTSVRVGCALDGCRLTVAAEFLPMQTQRSKHTTTYSTVQPRCSRVPRLQIKRTLTFLQLISYSLRWVSHAPFCSYWSVVLCSRSLEWCFDNPDILLPNWLNVAADFISFSWAALLKINIEKTWKLTSVAVVVPLSSCEFYWRSFGVQAEQREL